jgi:phosphohistidine phosphatase
LLLLLLRHAKSDWSGSGKIDDHDRPLSARGRRSAPAMGAFMRAKRYEPALVLCSTARRAKETLELVLPSFRKEPKLRYQHALYLAEWPQILQQIQDAGKDSPLLVVGHNPGIEQLSVALSLQPRNTAEKGRAETLAAKFPTAALAAFEFEIKLWTEAKPGRGRLIDFVRPRDLTDADGGDE